MPSSSALRGIPLIEGGPMSTGITGSGGTGIVASANPSTTGQIAASVATASALGTDVGSGMATGAMAGMAVSSGMNSSLGNPALGLFLGEGVPPVPQKLATRIRKGEFIEMHELLPEFWQTTREEELDGKPGAKNRRNRKIIDIMSWLKCFSTYVAVRAPLAPQLIPEFMAYMATIIQVSQDYVGLAWVRYDAAFRRQAALKGDTKWSAINTTLFTLCCSVPSAKKRCELCLADTHSEGECAQRGDQEPELRDRMKAMEAAVLTMVKLAGGRSDQTPGNREICRKFNSVRGCGFSKCKYWHACSTCKVEGHSTAQCPHPPSQGWQGPGPNGTPRAGSRSRPY